LNTADFKAAKSSLLFGLCAAPPTMLQVYINAETGAA